MKERGKAVELYNNDKVFSDCYSSSLEVPCKKHPSSSSVGICAYCLKDRLVKLVCSDCGEQRLSSCSCSEISSDRNSCTVEVGSVGRISFLIENERTNEAPNPIAKPKSGDKSEEVFLLKRSSSSCVEIKRKNGFWRIGRFFRKIKREKDGVKIVGGCDEKSDLWVVDYTGVSRSRSLCSFRGGGFFGSEDGGDLMAFSGARTSISAARSSSVNGGLGFDAERKSGSSEAEPRRSGFEGRRSGFSEAEPRKSGFEGRKSGFSEAEPRKSGFEGRKSGFSEAEPRKSGFEGRKSGFSEAEPRKSGFDSERRDSAVLESDISTDIKAMKKGGLLDVDAAPAGLNGANRRVFSLKESYFTGGEDSGFIDLKFDFSSESKPDYSAVRMCGLSDSNSAFGSMRCSDFAAPEYGGSLRGGIIGNGVLSHAGSCRITVTDRGIKKSRKSFKGWKWIFRHHPSWISPRKKDDDIMVNP